MSLSLTSWCCRTLSILALMLLLCSSSSRADLFVFKDGFVVEGKVKREHEAKWMNAQAGFIVFPKGFFYVDDGARRVIFKQTDLREIVETGAAVEEHFVGGDSMQVNPREMIPILEVEETTPWDSKWARRITIRSDMQSVTLPQRISHLTPYFAVALSRGRYMWGCTYLTREMGREEVQGLLDMAPALQDNSQMPAEKRIALRYRKINFYMQAGWSSLAEQELDRLVKDFPEVKARVEDSRAAIAARRANEAFEKIKHRNQAGQEEKVRKLLADFPARAAAAPIRAKVQEMESQYKTVAHRIIETGRLLEEIRKIANGPDLVPAARYILANLRPENVDRLETFLGQARQFERQTKAGRNPTTTPDQLLALAVSGWLLGNAASDPKPEAAADLWQAGEMVLSYLRTESLDARKGLLHDYLHTRKSPPPLDEIVRMIPNLPPVEPEEKTAQEVQERVVTGAGGKVSYLLQVPPEYRPTRSYPVFIALHHSGQKPRDLLTRWSALAAENGYLLAVPEWENGLSGYTFSEGENAVVLETLRDLRRHFQVDSDRVFLFGWGEGGKMAFDVGLGHPSLFAGVIPMAASPHLFANAYWRNGQYLPFYLVHGNRGEQDSASRAKELFTFWTQRGGTAFPSMWVDYKGRGVEWYAGELENIFDWIHPKRRIFPLHQVGVHKGNVLDLELSTLRGADNRFYWLTANGLFPRLIKNAENFRFGRIEPGTLAAHIDTTQNTVFVHARGFGSVTVWLGRDSKGGNMVNFAQPLTVIVNGMPRVTNQRINPDLGTLLEDLYQRGDRQQLFLASITVNNP